MTGMEERRKFTIKKAFGGGNLALKREVLLYSQLSGGEKHFPPGKTARAVTITKLTCPKKTKRFWVRSCK